MALDWTLTIYVVNFFLALSIVFLERRRPSWVFVWILVLFFLPWVGFFLYIIIGRRPSLRRKRALENARMERSIIEGVLSDRGDIVLDPDCGRSGAAREFDSLVRMLQVSRSFLTCGNRVRIITEGPEKYDLLLGDIRNARHHVHLEYFVIRDDEMGRKVLSALIGKARQGVEVRLLFDDVGGRPSPFTLRSLKEAGGRYERFFPSYIPVIRWLNLNINYRNHRKIAVIDGRIGYVGGFNIGDEYIGKNTKLGHWRDTHLRIEGRATFALQLRFMLDWNYASEAEGRMKPSASYFPELAEEDGAAIQIVSSGPLRRQELIQESFLKMIASARRSINIQTPYFIPDKSIMDLLRIAALSGVEVRIMVPRRKDQVLVHWASASYLGELLYDGVKVYYYEDGFLHSKTITVDGKMVSIGSANWDIRGFRLDFETNAVVYDEEVGMKHDRIFEEDLKNCSELTTEMYHHRGLEPRIKESLSRLASPIL